jgi:hypothetical protein
MIEERIAELVSAHYAKEGAQLLLLSNFGVQLSKLGLWPIPGETRSLHDVVKSVATVEIIPDPDAQSFLAVVLVGDEARAHDAIERRHRLAFLRTIPRAVLLAFTVETPEDQPIYIRLEPRPGYVIGPEAAPEGHVVIESEFRLPGVDIGKLHNLSIDQIESLGSKIRLWCDNHNIDPGRFGRREASAIGTESVDRKSSSALERLYAAQPPDIAKRLAIPLDIALALSRLP